MSYDSTTLYETKQTKAMYMFMGHVIVLMSGYIHKLVIIWIINEQSSTQK